MILYNITVSIDPEIEESWVDWMKKVHIPDVMGTDCFREGRISRVHGEEEGGLTYAITYLSHTQASYNKYQDEFAEKLQNEHSTKFAGKFAAFRTLLTVIEEFK